MNKKCYRCHKDKDIEEFLRRGKYLQSCNKCRERDQNTKSIRTGKESKFLILFNQDQEAAKNGNLICRKCRIELPKEYFTGSDEFKKGTTLYCKSCRREKSIVSKLKSYYNFTLEQFNDLVKKQDFKCALCDLQLDLNTKGHNKINSANIDHCHKTGKVRGILCNNCNRGLGLLKDNSDILLKAYNYLKQNE